MFINDTIDFEDEISAVLAEGDDELGFFEFWSPGEIETYMKEVSAKVVSLDRDIAANDACFIATDLDDWSDYKARYAEFMRAHDDWWERLSTGVLRQAERFARELLDFQTRFTDACKKPPSATPITIPKDEYDADIRSFGSGITTIVLVVVGGILLMKFLDKR